MSLRMNESDYLFVCLLEEAAELQKEICKLLRFGPNGVSVRTNDTPTERLREEVAQFQATIKLLQRKGYFEPLSGEENTLRQKDKLQRLENYLARFREEKLNSS